MRSQCCFLTPLPRSCRSQGQQGGGYFAVCDSTCQPVAACRQLNSDWTLMAVVASAPSILQTTVAVLPWASTRSTEDPVAMERRQSWSIIYATAPRLA